MLDFAKKCLRIRRDNTAFDDEVADLIAACKADLRKHGVVKISESDPLIKQAVKLYPCPNLSLTKRHYPAAQKSRFSWTSKTR